MLNRFLLVLACVFMLVPSASAQSINVQRLGKADPGYTMDLTATYPAGVYYIGDALLSAHIKFDKASAFIGKLFGCAVKNADADRNNSVDTTANCVELANLASTGTFSHISAHNYYVLDVDTPETGVNVSRLTIRGANTAGGGGGVTLVTESTLPVTGDASLIYRITNATDGGDCAAGTPGTEQADCRWNGTTYEPISQGTAGLANVADDLSPSLGGPLDPNGESIGTRNFYAANDTELASALTSCDAGIGQNKQTGCTIYLEGGQYTMGSTRALAGDGTAAQGRNGLKIVGMGGGYGPANSNQYPNAGTVISWTGGASPMFTMGAGMLALIDVAIDGNGAATDGIDILNSSGAPNKLHFERVSFYGFTDCAIDGTDGGQFDESTFEHVYIEQSACAIRTSHSQSIGITLGPKFQVTNMTGSGPFIDVVAGSVLLKDSYCGLVSDGQTCVHFGQGANQFRIENTQFEGPGATRTGLVFIDADDGGVNQEVRELIVKDSQFIIGGAGNTALDFLGRGNLVWEDNNFVDTDAGVADSLAITIDRDSGSANNRLRARIANNWRNNAGTRVPERWLPTIDQTVDVQSPIYSADIRPESCSWWEVMRDTNETGGRQVYACESGAWVLQGDGIGDVTQVAGYASGQAFVEGVASTGSVVLTMEGTTLDANEFVIALQDDDPSADITWYQPDAASLIIFPTGVKTLMTIEGAESLTNKTLIAPLISGRMDMNIGPINDNDCTGNQGDWWYDTTDSRFEWCNANSGTPLVLGSGSSIFDTSGIYATTTEDLLIGGDGDNTPEAGEVEITDGNIIAESFTARPDADAGDSLVLSEGTNDGGQTFSLKVPDAGIGGSNVLCELDSAGKIPATCLSGISAGGDEVTVNGVAQTNPDFDDATPAAPAGSTNVEFQASSNNVSAAIDWGTVLDGIRQKPFYYNDFTGGQNASINREGSDLLDFAVYASGTLFQVGNTESVFSQENHPGQIAIRASATANSGGAFLTGFNGANTSHFDLDGGEIAEFIFQQKEATGTIIRMGFHDSGDHQDPTYGIFIELDADLNAECETTNGGGANRANSAIATLTADTWYRARITVNADKTAATCQIWNDSGVSQGSATNTTHLPADNNLVNFVFGATHTAGSASTHIAWLDWMAYAFTRNLTR